MQLPFISLPRARALTAVIAGLGCAAPALATLDVEAMAPQETFAASGPALHLAQTSTPPAPSVSEAPATGETAPGTAPPARRVHQPWAYDTLPQPHRPEQPDDERVHFLVGVAANTSPNFFGGKSQDFKLKPVGALQWGRWRLSTGGGYGLMGQGRRDRGSGAQAVLRETDDFNLSLSLNIDRGRDVADTERLKGVPDVRATLRARVRALQPH